MTANNDSIEATSSDMPLPNSRKIYVDGQIHPAVRVPFSVMSSGNVTLHPFKRDAAAVLRACPERAQRVERETSLTI
jgi:hypothetical protein